jgi:hypothetical protein
MKNPLPADVEAAGKNHVTALNDFLTAKSKLYRLGSEGKKGSEEWNAARAIYDKAETAYKEAKAEDKRISRDLLARF